jgi:beta-galactosidase
MLAQRQSFTLYMAHGGTSFGFDAGASSPPFSPQTTSHDYDAPIDEAGRATPKFHAIRSLVAQHLGPGERLPDLPALPAVVSVPRVTLGSAAALLEQLGTRERLGEIAPLEALQQAHGAVLYRGTLPAGGPATLKLVEPHDVAYVDLDGRRLDVLERSSGSNTLKLGARTAPARLDLFVEALGRVSYGSDLYDRKGITQRVELVDERGSTQLGPWEIFPLPLDAQQLARLSFTAVQRPLGSAAVYRGQLELARVGDTFLDLRGWSRGLVWVNGHALGRYSKAGPQQTLYLPGAWLKKGANQVLVLDIDGGTTTLALQGLDHPILDQVGVEPVAARKLRKSGQELQLGGLAPVITETFADVQAEQRASFPATKARYVALVALGSQPEDPSTSCAEIWLVGSGGVELPRSSWSVIWADSEELEAQDGAGRARHRRRPGHLLADAVERQRGAAPALDRDRPGRGAGADRAALPAAPGERWRAHRALPGVLVQNALPGALGRSAPSCAALGARNNRAVTRPAWRALRSCWQCSPVPASTPSEP